MRNGITIQVLVINEFFSSFDFRLNISSIFACYVTCNASLNLSKLANKLPMKYWLHSVDSERDAMGLKRRNQVMYSILCLLKQVPHRSQWIILITRVCMCPACNTIVIIAVANISIVLNILYCILSCIFTEKRLSLVAFSFYSDIISIFSKSKT